MVVNNFRISPRCLRRSGANEMTRNHGIPLGNPLDFWALAAIRRVTLSRFSQAHLSRLHPQLVTAASPVPWGA